MALTMMSGLTQETFDAIAAEMLIKADDNFTVLQQVIPQAPQGGFEKGAKTLTFNQPDLPTGTYTEVARRLTEGTAITAASKAITMSTKTLTVREYGGPDVAGTVTPFGITEKLAKMSKHDLVPIIGAFMRRDRNKWMDAVIRNDMLTTTVIETADGSAEGAIAAGAPASAAWLRRLNKTCKDALIPTFPNGRHKLIISTKDERDLKNDDEIQKAFREFAQANPILQAGQVGFYENFDIFVDTLMPTSAVGAAGAVTGYQGIAFGPYHEGHGVVMEPSIRYADDTDFQRQVRLLWVSLEAWGLLYGDYVVRTVTT